MARLTSTRAASHGQASSPPRASGQAPASSPPRRITRSTRSQSGDIDETHAPAKKVTRARNTRQGSMESAASDVSTTKGGLGRKTRGAAPIQHVLSVVAEDEEVEEPFEAEHEDQNTDDHNLSGTTAITSHSQQELADLDISMVVEVLPELHSSTNKLLDVVAPKGATRQVLSEITKEFQVPGSHKSKRLRHFEKAFENNKEYYGNDLFINTSFILRKLFGDQALEQDTYRPDVLLQEANFGTLMKSLMIAQQDHPKTLPILQRVDDLMPSPFLSGFDAEPLYGKSALVVQTFNLSLEVRTQVLIAIFKVYKDEPEFDPSSLLTHIFYDPPKHRDPSRSIFQDSLENGSYRAMGGIEEDEMTRPQRNSISERIDSIRESLNDDPEEIDDADYIDFERLERSFPWIDFLVHVVGWGKARLAEINRSIETQGGVDAIMSSLVDKLKATDSQISLEYEPPAKPVQKLAGPKRSLLPAAQIGPASPGKGLYKSAANVRFLVSKVGRPAATPPSNQQVLQRRLATTRSSLPAGPLEPKTPQDEPAPKLPWTAPSQMTQEEWPEADDGYRPLEFDEDDGPRPAATQHSPLSSQQMGVLMMKADAEKNKENRPLPTEAGPSTSYASAQSPKRKNFIDHQANAKRIAQISESGDEEDDGLAPPSKITGKRTREQFEEPDENDIVGAADEDDVSEDGAFEQDPNKLPERMQIPPPDVIQLQGGPRKRAKIHTRLVSHGPGEGSAAAGSKQPRIDTVARMQNQAAADRKREAEAEALRTSKARANLDASEEEEEEEQYPPAATYSEIQETAQRQALRHRMHAAAVRPTQKRVPWSKDETEGFVDLIERFGCSWSKLLQLGFEEGVFHESRDQGKLKDKARNIKVEYLIARATLPTNFDNIALGEKENQKVRNGGANPYRMEGEQPGEEARDENGEWRDGRVASD